MSALGEQPLTPFKFQRYTVDNGLSQGTILSMHQDKKGFLWLGTENGLNRFDGYNFVQFKSLKGHDVRAIAESADGDLWVGTTDALNVLPNGQEKFEFVAMAFATSTQSKNIQSLTFDTSGVLWIGTAQGLFKKNLNTGLSTGNNTSLNTDIEKVNLLQY
ncbi:MAG: ligand-binding sensor domain-containing protein, partial [Colwellia sp.]